MAVNENLYNWMLKTQGMPAAEWYRNNPTKPHTSNPHVPPGAAKWFPSASADDPQKQRTASTLDPLRDPGTYASASPEFEEVSVIEPAASSDYFQQFLDSLDASQRADIEGMFDLTAEEKKDIGYNYAARQKLGDLTPAQNKQVSDLISYNPNYGEYGGYSTKEDLGFSPSSALYDRYQEAIKNIPLRYADDPLQVGHRALYGTSAGQGSDQGYQMVLANEADRQARAKAYEDIYQTPLSQLPYKSYSEAKEAGKTLEDYRADLAKLNIDIPLAQGNSTYFLRGATPDDPEVQQYGIYNVGRSDYRTARQNEAVQKNIEELKRQSSQSPQGFLDDYVDEGSWEAKDNTDVAVQYGDGFPKKPAWLKQLDDEYNKTKGQPLRPGTPKPGRGMGDVWEGPLREASGPQGSDSVIANALSASDEQRQQQAFQSEYDPQKAKTATNAAKAYKQAVANEDPFRSQAVFG